MRFAIGGQKKLQRFGNGNLIGRGKIERIEEGIGSINLSLFTANFAA
jgi:hypothetical protein